jgi:hypothetical protein
MLKPNRWDLEVDPDLVLPEAERYRRADAAQAAFYVAQGLAARRRNRERKAAAAGVDVPPPGDEERRLIGRLGGLRARAKHDPHAATEVARAAAEARYALEVDPNGILSPAERTRRARAARSAYFASILLKSLDARAAGRGRRGGEADEAERAAQLKATKQKVKGRLGAYRSAARHDPARATAAARQANEILWRERVDPSGEVPPDELEEKVRLAKQEHFREMAKLSAEKRKRATRASGS